MMTPSNLTNPRTRAAGRVLAMLMLTALAMGVGACANPPTVVDPGFFPEGNPHADARLVIWQEESNFFRLFEDHPPIGPLPTTDPQADPCGMPRPGFEDQFLGVFTDLTGAPVNSGAVHGIIVDGTPASAYQVFRREMGGGYRQFQDFNADRFRQWLFTGWEASRFVDPVPSGMTPASYVGRGVVEGTVTPESPLTNTSMLDAAGLTPMPEILLTSPRKPRDSLFVVAWEPVAGAEGYWLQIYDQPPISPDQAFQRGAPAPFFDGAANEVFVGFIQRTDSLPEPSTTYKIGDETRSDVEIFMKRSTFFSRIYIVRITAVDTNGQMIATTRGNDGIKLAEFELPSGSVINGYALFPLGGFAVCPSTTVALEGQAPIGDLPSMLADGRVAWRVPRVRVLPR